MGNASNAKKNINWNALNKGMALFGMNILKLPDIYEKLLIKPKLKHGEREYLPKHLELSRDSFTKKFYELRRKLIYFTEAYCMPFEKQQQLHRETTKYRNKVYPKIERLKNKAKELGLWNLFLPKECKESPGLTNLEYAPLCEIMGKYPSVTPEACNCSAPDTGNMEVLAKYGTKEQKQKWLIPLMNGEIRSCFGMTEPKVASSDARNIETDMKLTSDGQHYIINGRKWWSSGAMDQRVQYMLHILCFYKCYYLYNIYAYI